MWPEVTSQPEVSLYGVEMMDLEADSAFLARPQRPRTRSPQMQGLHHLAHAFVDDPDTLLQKLVDCALELCGADSAGISLEIISDTGEVSFRWVATAGLYGRFLDAVLPAFPAPCARCLERDRPQHYRVGQPFFDYLGIQAELVNDGLLIPWHIGGTRGTIWILSHGSSEAFDASDAQTAELLADFAAIAMRQRAQHQKILDQATATAASQIANELAHQINNPLQSLTNLVYLAAEGPPNTDTRELARQMADDLRRLSTLVSKLLALPSTGL